jgi:hypothetical protein
MPPTRHESTRPWLRSMNQVRLRRRRCKRRVTLKRRPRRRRRPHPRNDGLSLPVQNVGVKRDGAPQVVSRVGGCQYPLSADEPAESGAANRLGPAHCRLSCNTLMCSKCRSTTGSADWATDRSCGLSPPLA